MKNTLSVTGFLKTQNPSCTSSKYPIFLLFINLHPWRLLCKKFEEKKKKSLKFPWCSACFTSVNPWLKVQFPFNSSDFLWTHGKLNLKVCIMKIKLLLKKNKNKSRNLSASTLQNRPLNDCDTQVADLLIGGMDRWKSHSLHCADSSIIWSRINKTRL